MNDLYNRLCELAKDAAPLPLDILRKYLAEATHRCETALGERPKRWSVLFSGGVLWGIECPKLEPEIEALLTSLGWSRLRFFLRLFALWEASGQKVLNPFEPMVQICRHGGNVGVAGDGLLDLEDYTGQRLGIPISSTFTWEKL